MFQEPLQDVCSALQTLSYKQGEIRQLCLISQCMWPAHTESLFCAVCRQAGLLLYIYLLMSHSLLCVACVSKAAILASTLNTRAGGLLSRAFCHGAYGGRYR